MEMIFNRLLKNYKRLSKWARRNSITAYRLYDRDIPEYPYIVDIYGDYAVIYERTLDWIDELKGDFKNHVIAAVKEVLNLSDDKIIYKARRRQEGDNQYSRFDKSNEEFIVTEGPLKLIVNVKDYLDTGLFLDHRPMRKEVLNTVKGKSFLNLFCYTGSVSVAAAMGGATVTSVDMSKTYTSWAIKNFEANNLNPSDHRFINDNCFTFLQNGVETYDVIFLDPPTFSNSKKMDDSFDVERDQVPLVEACMKRLKKDGVLYFSNNKRRFRLSKHLEELYDVQDITKRTIPEDFHDQKIHVCYKITWR